MSTRLSISRYDLPSIINEKKYRIGAEVGVNHGAFSYYLLKHSNLSLLYSVDHYPIRSGAHICRDAESLLSEFGQRSVRMLLPSVDAASQLAKDKVALDFVYIDGAHDLENVRADLTAWWPLIRDGGMMAGHDYINSRHWASGVIPGVDEFCDRNGLDLQLTREVWASWIITKPSHG